MLLNSALSATGFPSFSGVDMIVYDAVACLDFLRTRRGFEVGGQVFGCLALPVRGYDHDPVAPACLLGHRHIRVL